MGCSKLMMATLSMGKGHLQASLMLSRPGSMLSVSGAWSQVAEESMANRMTMKRRVIWGGGVQIRPSMRRRVWVCESAVVLLVMSIKTVMSAGETCWVVEVGCVVGRKSL